MIPNPNAYVKVEFYNGEEKCDTAYETNQAKIKFDDDKKVDSMIWDQHQQNPFSITGDDIFNDIDSVFFKVYDGQDIIGCCEIPTEPSPKDIMEVYWVSLKTKEDGKESEDIYNEYNEKTEIQVMVEYTTTASNIETPAMDIGVSLKDIRRRQTLVLSEEKEQNKARVDLKKTMEKLQEDVSVDLKQKMVKLQEDVSQKLLAQTKENSKLKDGIITVKTEHQQSIDGLKEKHQSQMANLKSQNQEEIKTLNASYMSKINELKAGNVDMIKDIESKHKGEIARLRSIILMSILETKAQKKRHIRESVEDRLCMAFVANLLDNSHKSEIDKMECELKQAEQRKVFHIVLCHQHTR